MKSVKRGFTLLEVVIGVAIVGIVCMAMVAGFNGMRKNSASVEDRMEVNVDAARLITRILRMGRIARTCLIVPGTIQCTVDMNTPPTPATGDDTVVRFRRDLSNYRAVYEVRSGATWDERDSFKNIVGFDVCTYTEMKNNTCPFSDEISVDHVSNVDTGTDKSDPARFFRFRVTSQVIPTSGPANGRKFTARGAFYVRHPANDPNIWMQIGSRD